MADLRDMYDKGKIAEIASNFHKVAADFPEQAFVEAVFADGWEALSLRERQGRLAQLAYEFLNRPFNQVAPLLQELNTYGQGFAYLFLPDMVALYGLEDFPLAFETLAVLTTGSSAEFAIRPFLAKDFTKTFEQMQLWAQSDNEHHRRLASEGLRPRLPWGKRVSAIDGHEEEILCLLEQLRADASLYVRKSVANHLNDWTKIDPERVLDLLATWQGGSKETDWIIKQAARSLLKAGHPKALSLFGYLPDLSLARVQLQPSSTNYRKGDQMTVAYDLALSEEEGVSKLRLELQVGFIKKNGQASFKTFMLKDTETRGGASLQGIWAYHWLDKTTRKHYNGHHSLRLLVNGQVQAEVGVFVSGF